MAQLYLHPPRFSFYGLCVSGERSSTAQAYLYLSTKELVSRERRLQIRQLVNSLLAFRTYS